MPLAPASLKAILQGSKRKAEAAPAPAAKRAAVAASPADAPKSKSADAATKAVAKPSAAAAPASQKAVPKPVAPAPAPASAPPTPKAVAPAPAFRTLGGGLQVKDIRVGKGVRAARGKKVTVKYAGSLTNGKRFDAGNITFRLGAGEVIKGWDEGVASMQVGGKRQLKIPPALGYGRRGSPPVIPGNATLMFDVELINVR
eukprot:6203202-Pleurochrysis_carterae.AAC.1